MTNQRILLDSISISRGFRSFFFLLNLFLCYFVLYKSFVWRIILPQEVMKIIIEWIDPYA